jgi:hypothetical protein
MATLVTPGILDTPVSFFQKYTDTTNPTTGTFFQIVTSEKLAAQYTPLIAQIRATADKDERDKLKKRLPCFTPSGTFSRRAADGLLKHSGLIQFDIDPKQNPALTALNAPSLRDKIARFRHVAYCALSASGTGVWGVVRIAHPDRHKEHFAALAADFAKWGIVIDPACSNVDRLRFWSYDPDAYFNPNAATYSKLTAARPEKHLPVPAPPSASPPRCRIEGDNAAKVEAILGQIEASRTDITDGYDTWFSIGCALANEFGESGRDYFHSIGQFHPEYNRRDTDRQFSYCLRMKSNRYTLGTFFEIARRYGIEYKGHLPRPSETHAHAAPQPPTAHKPAPSALPPGYRRERFTDRETGQPFVVLLNGDGYPATWDLPDEQRENLARMIRKNPAVTELIARFDLKLEA